MLSLPQSTEFNKRIPKQKFYENLTITPALKRLFTEQIKTIYWKNKVAPSTTNLGAGQKVEELEVFEVRLNFPYLDENILKQIDREIPYHILFLLEYEGKYQAWIGYKEAAGSGNNAFKVNVYYHTDWCALDKIQLKLDGLDMDSVYESLVRQIGGERLATADKTENISTSIEKSQQREKLQKEIEKLQTKISREKQFNRKVELNAELKKLRKQLEEI